MWPVARWMLGVLCCGIVGGVETRGDETAPDPGARQPASTMWLPMANVRLLGGYKDNVLLSSYAAEGAPFLGVGVDAFVWSLFGAGTEMTGVLLGENREIFGVDELDREQTLYGMMELRHDRDENWRVGGALDYLYQDQVLDVSATEAVLVRARVRAHNVGMRSSVRRAVGDGWLELQMAGQRQLYAGEWLDDHWQLGPRLTLGWAPRERVEIGLSYEVGWRWHDQEEERTITGEPIPGTRRAMIQHDVALRVRKQWGEEGQWRMTGRLSGRVNKDQGSGYYDYVRPRGTLRLRYRRGGWEFESGGRLTYYGYGAQTVSLADLERRRRFDVGWDIRVQRRLYGPLSGLIEYQHERTFANRRAEQYYVNTVWGGVDWEF